MQIKCTAVPSVFTQQKHSHFTMIVTFCFIACKTKYWKCCRLLWDSCSLWKFFFRGQVATMTTLVEINGALGVRHLFCALRVGSPPPPLVLCTAPIQLPSSPPPSHHSVCPQNQSVAWSSAGPSPGNSSEISCFIPGHLRKVGHTETMEHCRRDWYYRSCSVCSLQCLVDLL